MIKTDNTLLNTILNIGTKIFTNKSKYLHICNKRDCNNISLSINNSNIKNESNLILDIIFNHKCKWNVHITHLCPWLQNRLNVIKCLCYIKLESDSSTLLHTLTINIVNLIIIFLENYYGFSIFGKTSKRNWTKMASIYHTVDWLAIRVFRTTPISNILAEANLSSLENR